MGYSLQKYTTWDTFIRIMSKNGGFRFLFVLSKSTDAQKLTIRNN